MLRITSKMPGAKRQDEPEFLWGVILLPLFGLVSLVIASLPDAWRPACRFHQWTGIPCPTCGGTRAQHLLARGHPLQALRVQPLLTVTSFLLGAFVLYSWYTISANKPRLRVQGWQVRHTRRLLVALLATLLVNWLFLVLTGV